MKLTFLIVIVLLALIMPLLWITGAFTSIIYFCRHRAGTTRKEWTIAFNPQLGLTMADGGDPMDEKKKESATVMQTMTEPSQGSPEQSTRRPISVKMFWWGGYY